MAAVMNSVVIIPKDLKNGDFGISRRGRETVFSFLLPQGNESLLTVKVKRNKQFFKRANRYQTIVLYIKIYITAEISR